MGLWKLTDPKQFSEVFNTAVETGYRHFDTAQIYGNESMLGECIARSGVAREEFFVTTKIHVKNFGYNQVKKSFKESLQNLQTDYVDLLLLHFPVSILRNKAWQALEEIKNEGLAKNIGVSNYTVRHLESLLKSARVKPAVNQVELHVYLQQPELLAYCKKHEIVVEAYSPLAHGHDFKHKTLLGLAKKYDKTPAQIMLRWCIEKNLVILPKSAHPKRVQENFEVFDFTLDDVDMKELAGLDQNIRTCWDPTYIP